MSHRPLANLLAWQLANTTLGRGRAHVAVRFLKLRCVVSGDFLGLVLGRHAGHRPGGATPRTSRACCISCSEAAISRSVSAICRLTARGEKQLRKHPAAARGHHRGRAVENNPADRKSLQQAQQLHVAQSVRADRKSRRDCLSTLSGAPEPVAAVASHRPADCQHTDLHAGSTICSPRRSAFPANCTSAARAGARLSQPSRTDRREVHPQSVQQRSGRAAVQDRRSRALSARREHRVPGPPRPSGQDPRLPHRAGRDRSGALAALAGQRGRRAGPGRHARTTSGWWPTSFAVASSGP